MKEDFFYDLLKNTYHYFELGSLILAVFFYKKYKYYSFYKFFTIYITNIILFKAIDYFIGDGTSGVESNYDLYNIYTFFEFNFFALIYYSLIKNILRLRLVIGLILLFNCIYFLSFYFTTLSAFTVQIEGLFNSILIIVYFIELLNSNDILNYKKLFPFWMSVGFLVFYLTSIPFFTLLYLNLFDTRSMFNLLYALIILFHSCFIYGLISCKKAEDE
jgi:hypothetical protein